MTTINEVDRSAVIARSIMMHPSLFAEECDRVARIHRDFALIAVDRTARETAARMAAQLCEFADGLRRGTASVPDADNAFGLSVMVFEVARRLQCLPPGWSAADTSVHDAPPRAAGVRPIDDNELI
jgi:hypothetical protein